MRYKNGNIPEGINVSKTHPLADFGGLLVGVAGIFLVIMSCLYFLSGWLLPYVPFSLESNIVSSYKGDTLFSGKLTDEQQQVQRYLQSLANGLTAHSGLPEDVTLTVHYSDSEQKNAFATLGGNILIQRGLLHAVESENGLAMLLGHEIGHIVHRDPLMTLGRSAVSLGALALLSGFSQTSVANTVFTVSTESLMFSFSRDQERAADAYALTLLKDYYGHKTGADEFFVHIQKAGAGALGDSNLAEFFSTHPNTQERIVRIKDSIASDQRSETAQLTTLPDFAIE
ncbi:MAG: putative Zn-dependent protease [Halioglobus sp.]|jgi:predicted Zn-dependent protease